MSSTAQRWYGSLNQWQFSLQSVVPGTSAGVFPKSANESNATDFDDRIRYLRTSSESKVGSAPSWSSIWPGHGGAASTATWLIDARNHGSRIIETADPQIVMDLLLDALNDCSQSLGSKRPRILRLLQDLVSETGELPRRVRLPSISDLKFVSSGGEATIWRGRLEGKIVVSRQTNHPTIGDEWDSKEGCIILKTVRREVITLLQIDHPNIVPFLGTTSDEYHPLALVSPFYQHGHALLYLKGIVDTERPVAFLRICTSIASALDYLHSQTPQIIHGDLHARNIVIDTDGKALLIDFGLARIKHEVTRTTTGLIEGGRYRYLAPELLLAPEPGSFRTSPATDCYAFAMTILEMATRDRPFAEFTHELRAARAAEKGIRPARPDDLGGLNVMAADALWAYLGIMWAREPSERPNMEQVESSLTGILNFQTSAD